MSMTKTYKAGEIICNENSYEMWMYELVSGSVEVIKDYGTAEEETLSVITSGYFGEMGLIDALPRTATVVAKEDTTVAIIDEDALNSYFEDAPEKVAAIFICLAERLGKLNENYLEACQTVKTYLGNESKDNAVTAAMKKFASIFRAR